MIKIERIPEGQRALVGSIVQAAEGAAGVDVPALAVALDVPDDHNFRRAWSAANSIMHGRGGGFVPSGEGAGRYVRATTQQKIGRAKRFRSAAARKIGRQYLSLHAADPAQLPEQERDGFRRMVDRVGLQSGRAIAALTRIEALPSPADSRKDTLALPRGK